jgi:hypothetical protein
VDDLPAHRPAIDRIPGTALDDVLAHGARPWGGEPVSVPVAVTVVLWLVGAANLAFGGWLTAVELGGAPCGGLPCTVATWDRPGLLLALAAACVAVVLAVAVGSHGLTELRPVPLAAALAAAVCGLVAVAGVLALLVAVLAGAALAALLLFVLVDRF